MALKHWSVWSALPETVITLSPCKHHVVMEANVKYHFFWRDSSCQASIPDLPPATFDLTVIILLHRTSKVSIAVGSCFNYECRAAVSSNGITDIPPPACAQQANDRSSARRFRSPTFKMCPQEEGWGGGFSLKGLKLMLNFICINCILFDIREKTGCMSHAVKHRHSTKLTLIKGMNI